MNELVSQGRELMSVEAQALHEGVHGSIWPNPLLTTLLTTFTIGS
jgi:hypothetical protein